MRRVAILVGAVAAIAAIGGAAYWLTRRPVPVPASGVPLDLARDRAERVSKLEYFLTVDVPESRTQPVRARIIARFELSDASRPLALDFNPGNDQVTSATANGEPFDGNIQNGHVIIPSSHLIEGENHIDVDFIAGDPPLNRQDDLLYTLFVPARASATFPCFDQPNLKGIWRVTLLAARTLGGGVERSGRERRADRQGPADGRVRTDQAAADLSRRVCRRTVQRRTRRTERPDVPDAAPGNGSGPHRAESGGDFRPARAGDRLARGVHGHPLPVPQVRLHPDSRVPVQRHGTPRRRVLQRELVCSSTRRPPSSRRSDARTSSPTRRRTCGSEISSRCRGSTTSG